MGLDQYAYVKTAESGEEGESPKFTWRKHSKLQTFMEALYTERTGLSASDLNCGELKLEPVEMLAFLTTRHRRASPSNVSEQPRMSLGARRDYHAFLTTPIIRQALTVVVPEYDRVAPVLAKPVRPGLYALAQGSLLQTFALTVGIGSLVEDPVDQAIAVLLSGDAEWQRRLKDVLKSWPLSLRRRISARLWRAQRDESARQITEKAGRRRQSHKYRRVQSHKYRYRRCCHIYFCINIDR